MSSTALLRVEGLEAFYGRAQVLFGLDLSLQPGEVLALIGRNGAGKSTTLKALIGLVERRATRLTFGERDIRRWPSHRIARAGLGYVPEDRRIFTDLTVAENLEVGRRPPRPSQAAWTPGRLFRIFPNLAAMQGRRASQMSGGEQQMLAIARTLMGNPALVLLDEPSEGIAPVIVELLAEAVLAMKREGIAVLLCEQNLAFAGSVADKVAVIERGAVAFAGSMAALEANPALRDAHLGL